MPSILVQELNPKNATSEGNNESRWKAAKQCPAWSWLEDPIQKGRKFHLHLARLIT